MNTEDEIKSLKGDINKLRRYINYLRKLVIKPEFSINEKVISHGNIGIVISVDWYDAGSDDLGIWQYTVEFADKSVGYAYGDGVFKEIQKYPERTTKPV